jgi:hypothetical protein
MITYTATNTLNGKFYIWSTTNFENRKKGHLQSKSNYPFQNALRKNPEAFEWEFVEDDCEEPVLEQALLDMWHGTEQCYNLNPSASRPPVLKGETHPMFGVPKSEQEKQKNRDAHLGKKATRETKEKMSIARRGENNPMYGKTGEDCPAFERKWWVNKLTQKECFSVESPGEGWELGRKEKSDVTVQRLREVFRGEGNPMWGKTGENAPAYGRKWWVNAEGKVKYQNECPGENWVNGRTWKRGKTLER